MAVEVAMASASRTPRGLPVRVFPGISKWAETPELTENLLVKLHNLSDVGSLWDTPGGAGGYG